MLSQAVDHPWDLTPVIDLIYSLSSKDDPFIAYNGSLPSTITQPTDDGEARGCNGEQSLGNFDKLWEFLGQSFDTPPLSIAPPSLAIGDSLSDESRGSSGDFPSEQALHKLVDPQDGLEEKDTPKDEALHATPQPSNRTKKSKRKRREEAPAQEVQLASYGGPPIIRTSSGEESDTGLQQLQYSSDRKSIIYEILYGNIHNRRKSTSYGNPVPPKSTSKNTKAKDWPTSKSGQHTTRWQPDTQDYLSAAAKKAKLVLSLCERFPAEKDCISALGAPKSLPTSNCLASTTVHVFVDVSNVSLGQIY
jgi:hypothetical protein